MSTTSDLNTALQYSLSVSSVLFRFVHVRSLMQRGADLKFLSAFPAESEYLYPPLTFLRPTGKHAEISIKTEDVPDLPHEIKYTVIEVEPFM